MKTPHVSHQRPEDENLGFVANMAYGLQHVLTMYGGIVAVPLIAAWLYISLMQAFMLDIGVLLFFLPYTYVYHWAYDVVRERMLLARSVRACSR